MNLDFKILVYVAVMVGVWGISFLILRKIYKMDLRRADQALVDSAAALLVVPMGFLAILWVMCSYIGRIILSLLKLIIAIPASLFKI